MSKYPEGLLNWSGDKAGGVKKLFYKGSGRPSGIVITTGLLARLQSWARDIANGKDGTPRAIFLVGGPGNGKSEAVEFTIHQLDASMQLESALQAELASRFSGEDGGVPGRLVSTRQTQFPKLSNVTSISIVQDGSEAERGDPTSPAEHLCNDIRSLVRQPDGHVYIACVNRGILDDALILAMEREDSGTSELLKKIVQSASLGSAGIDCWPLENYPGFAAWPMDVESLVEESEGHEMDSAARQILSVATNPTEWPRFGACAAGERCPFCTNRELLADKPRLSSLVRILRWFELASGKRWNFRDLFSLTSYLLAGTTESGSRDAYQPCEWAKGQLFPSEPNAVKREAKRIRGLFKLVAAQYQHALFGSWPVERATSLRNDIKELGLEDQPALVGLQRFLSLDKRKETTSTLRTQLAVMGSYLDPALASPSLEVAVSANTTIKFEDLDRRFSLSIKEGRTFLQKYQCLSNLEIDLLKSLEEADAKLSDESTRRRKPAVAERLQAFIRLVACKVARRSVGVRSGITKDSDVLVEFDQILGGGINALQIATQEVEGLLNKDRKFQVSLNTTFGEPLPPPERRVMLTTDIQRVRPMPPIGGDSRPRLPMRFLSVGSGPAGQPVALTYELFKATKSLRKGMVPASLPRSVVALLDTTRAKLAGSVVRDEDGALAGAEIQLGIRDDVIVRNYDGSLVARRGQSR